MSVGEQSLGTITAAAPRLCPCTDMADESVLRALVPAMREPGPAVVDVQTTIERSCVGCDRSSVSR
jgi:hypothetical protein